MMDLYRPMPVSRGLAGTVGNLPFHPAVSADCGDMLVTLVGRSLVDRFGRLEAMGNDDGYSRAVIDDCVLSWLSIMGTVGSELSIGPPIWPSSGLRHIASVLINQDMAMISPLSASSARCSLRQLRRDLAPCLSSSYWSAP